VTKLYYDTVRSQADTVVNSKL